MVLNDNNECCILKNNIYELKTELVPIGTISAIKKSLVENLTDSELLDYINTNGFVVPSDAILKIDFDGDFTIPLFSYTKMELKFEYIHSTNFPIICLNGKIIIITENGGEKIPIFKKVLKEEDNLHVALAVDTNTVYYSSSLIQGYSQSPIPIYDSNSNYLGLLGIDEIHCPNNCLIKIDGKDNYLGLVNDENNFNYTDGSIFVRINGIPR